MFELRAGTPACLGAHDASDSTLSDALQTIFSIDDHATMAWHHLEFRLGYKYDIGMMLDDIITMVLAIRQNDAGLLEVDWPSSGFPYLWSIKWSATDVEIAARARDEPGAKELAGCESVRVERSPFVCAWQSILEIVFSCLLSSGYSSQQIAGLERLNAAVTGNASPG